MELSADELTEARRVIARALEEDLRYGPDVTTLATVSRRRQRRRRRW